MTVGGCSVEYEYKLLYISLFTLLHTECHIPAFYLFVQHCCRAPQRAFEKKTKFQFAIVCLRSHWVPVLWVSSCLSVTTTLFYSEIGSKFRSYLSVHSILLQQEIHVLQATNAVEAWQQGYESVHFLARYSFLYCLAGDAMMQPLQVNSVDLGS